MIEQFWIHYKQGNLSDWRHAKVSDRRVFVFDIYVGRSALRGHVAGWFRVVEYMCFEIVFYSDFHPVDQRILADSLLHLIFLFCPILLAFLHVDAGCR